MFSTQSNNLNFLTDTVALIGKWKTPQALKPVLQWRRSGGVDLKSIVIHFAEDWNYLHWIKGSFFPWFWRNSARNNPSVRPSVPPHNPSPTPFSNNILSPLIQLGPNIDKTQLVLQPDADRWRLRLWGFKKPPYLSSGYTRVSVASYLEIYSVFVTFK